MACCGGGYAENRFQGSVDKNFFCPICTDVLKDPVQCHNQHYFCRSCITKHLKNSQTCPVCMEKLTEEALSKPPRIVQDYLDGLVINCEHSERGCANLVELCRLEAHVSECVYKPVTCPNEKCDAIVNQEDLDEHTSEVCEYREVYCDECGDKMSVKKFGKHGCIVSKDVNEMKVAVLQIQGQVNEMSKTQKEMFEAMQNLTISVGQQSSLSGKAVAAPDAKAQGNIVVVGGQSGNGLSKNWDTCIWHDTVEVYSPANRTWKKSARLQQKRASATAHFYQGQVMVTGGFFDKHNMTNSIEYIPIYEYLPIENHKQKILTRNKRAGELAVGCAGHKTAVLGDHLWIVGGCLANDERCSKTIWKTPIVLPPVMTIKCTMKKAISYHALEVVDGNKLLVLGGSTTGFEASAVATVLLYDTATNVLQELNSLPFPVIDMATVKHGDDVMIIGGMTRASEYLNTIFKYNYKNGDCEQLPGMKYKRAECAAVICGKNVFVMGGYNDTQGYLNSVECFDLEHQVWYELPFMNEAKYKIAAVFVP